jgi:hypothetical protein
MLLRSNRAEVAVKDVIHAFQVREMWGGTLRVAICHTHDIAIFGCGCIYLTYLMKKYNVKLQ